MNLPFPNKITLSEEEKMVISSIIERASKKDELLESEIMIWKDGDKITISHYNNEFNCIDGTIGEFKIEEQLKEAPKEVDIKENLEHFIKWYWKEIDGPPYVFSPEDIVTEYKKSL